MALLAEDTRDEGEDEEKIAPESWYTGGTCCRGLGTATLTSIARGCGAGGAGGGQQKDRSRADDGFFPESSRKSCCLHMFCLLGIPSKRERLHDVRGGGGREATGATRRVYGRISLSIFGAIRDAHRSYVYVDIC